MAISGSPGVPSFSVSLAKNNSLHVGSITTNKPKSVVEQDMATALRRIHDGETVQIDARNMNFVALCELHGAHLRSTLNRPTLEAIPETA